MISHDIMSLIHAVSNVRVSGDNFNLMHNEASVGHSNGNVKYHLEFFYLRSEREEREREIGYICIDR
jgi:hypothetical protein